ncbi:MAG: alternative ribosome rescue aminoacyl-tRNA hydrolase ArfB [Dehalococcoidales bacterium]|nr:alternative ribosome rescue aminoacyl-tRNA hydrolase ArfB [Dehalococcoidales bacterium]
MIQITPTLTIDENEIHEEFIRSSGPGGQNVNKVATAVQLRFDVVNSTSLAKSEDVRQRLLVQQRGRINEKGVLILEARRFRTQAANRQDAIERLVELIRKAAQEPLIRYETKPTLGSKIRRLETKRRHAGTKHLRGSTPEE